MLGSGAAEEKGVVLRESVVAEPHASVARTRPRTFTSKALSADFTDRPFSPRLTAGVDAAFAASASALVALVAFDDAQALVDVGACGAGAFEHGQALFQRGDAGEQFGVGGVGGVCRYDDGGGCRREGGHGQGAMHGHDFTQEGVIDASGGPVGASVFGWCGELGKTRRLEAHLSLRVICTMRDWWTVISRVPN